VDSGQLILFLRCGFQSEQGESRGNGVVGVGGDLLDFFP
jgi:hypothetical protein